MNKLTFSILLGITTALALIFFVMPDFQSIPLESAKKVKLEEILGKFDEIRLKKEAIVSSYAAISDDDIKRLDSMLPEGPEIGELLVNLDLLVKKHRLQLTGIQFQKIERETTGRPRNAAEVALLAKKIVRYSKLPITLNMIGSYENFRKFIVELESIIRITDVRNITLGGGVTGSHTFTLQADTYYMSR
ncbi:MAG: hypothetical protein A3I44_04940 [Candidatus Sungbacteria bacterium RIFCSPLOWO2_02_FULL_51_17]|uniref:Pilus assembly protein PilO n=1 Tax=Candidatus Sungbacteria bacterium RIFCSPHIGHO2_02_FULL_51_29 TaxID=1802273 RepID=A0A1G2KVC4_9BACT|nr:MAG: hypothetical protein A2676_03805 [Candidatus Sungbacteria bacterium RIFCSPHIGHO2_01_FULL_51_22]OHA03388.1 MAG: hypothetical protein A3C16_05680 [Candidatus Sungbacteria bacterium RIFCSPHIGHO2_02_FULL_51_29]OHA05258.1 MAG: hypothetical protein A3B29_00165 [Candidatus Sungbacteria bacterium RIFCSPLOWO2_01_FULL_51_34]OHA11686.1 MAG: hypothetical protein A3I44_04940 [Candidatus Sungbacteria bacterium RIFCSPLOWO2_02_FULL_51_17]